MNAMVSVVIPTTAELNRSEWIARAIDSVTSQSNSNIEIIVAINGGKVDEGLVSQIAKRTSVQLLRLQKRGLKNAIVEGWRVASGEFVCFLDDDDELLAHSIEKRVEALKQNTNASAAFTDGYFKSEGKIVRPIINRQEFDQNDLFGSLLNKNWNASCASLFRKSSVSHDLFENDYRYSHYGTDRWLPPNIQDFGFSWTFASAKLVLQHKVVFVDKPCYLINSRPNTTSASLGAHLRTIAVLNAIRSLNPHKKYRSKIRKNLSRSHHSASCKWNSMGLRKLAFQHHWYSLISSLGGLRYLPYFRHLLRTTNDDA